MEVETAKPDEKTTAPPLDDEVPGNPDSPVEEELAEDLEEEEEGEVEMVEDDGEEGQEDKPAKASVKRGRGRPPKAGIAKIPKQPKNPGGSRGRPRKDGTPAQAKPKSASAPRDAPKRTAQPRKFSDEYVEDGEEEEVEAVIVASPKKKGRGRPPKAKTPDVVEKIGRAPTMSYKEDDGEESERELEELKEMDDEAYVVSEGSVEDKDDDDYSPDQDIKAVVVKKKKKKSSGGGGKKGRGRPVKEPTRKSVRSNSSTKTYREMSDSDFTDEEDYVPMMKKNRSGSSGKGRGRPRKGSKGESRADDGEYSPSRQKGKQSLVEEDVDSKELRRTSSKTYKEASGSDISDVEEEELVYTPKKKQAMASPEVKKGRGRPPKAAGDAGELKPKASVVVKKGKGKGKGRGRPKKVVGIAKEGEEEEEVVEDGKEEKKEEAVETKQEDGEGEDREGEEEDDEEEDDEEEEPMDHGVKEKAGKEGAKGDIVGSKGVVKKKDTVERRANEVQANGETSDVGGDSDNREG